MVTPRSLVGPRDAGRELAMSGVQQMLDPGRQVARACPSREVPMKRPAMGSGPSVAIAMRCQREKLNAGGRWRAAAAAKIGALPDRCRGGITSMRNLKPRQAILGTCLIRARRLKSGYGNMPLWQDRDGSEPLQHDPI